MKQRQILIGIRSEQDQVNEVKTAWKRAERGLSPQEPINKLYFLDMVSLMRILSPKRMELLKMLRAIGATNIRQLAIKLSRNYSNVYQDITELTNVGLVEMPKKNKYVVPWDLITIDIASEQNSDFLKRLHKAS